MTPLLSKVLPYMLALALTFGPNAVLADTPCEQAVPIEVGTSSPCTGLLLPETQARLSFLCMKVELPRLQVDFDKLKSELKIRTESLDRMLAVERNRADKLQVLLNEASTIPKQAKAWYESPYFLVSVGIVVGGAITFGAVYAATELGK